MKLSMLDMLRTWAALTGLVLAVGFFAAVYLGLHASPMLPMLVMTIGGFELFLYAQDVWLARSGRHG